MKTAMIKMVLTIGVLLFLCSATAWADGRKYTHQYNKHAYKANPYKINHFRYGQTPQHGGHDKKHYYAKRPQYYFERHHWGHHRHYHYRPYYRYHHQLHNFNYPYGHGFWIFWRSY